MKTKIGGKVFDLVNVLIMLALIAITIIPFWTCIVGSFSDGTDYMRGGVYLWPRIFTTVNYEFLLQDSQVFTAFLVSFIRTLVGTVTGVLFTSLAAYGLMSDKLKFKRFYIVFMLITMYFAGGVIPNYILYQKLHLIDNFLVYIIPMMFSVYNLIIIQSSFKEIPGAIAESARLDGANEYRIFWSLYLPMSKPVIAAISLFVAVGHWNSYFDSMMYTSQIELQTIQYYLYKIITQATQALAVSSRAQQAMPTDRMAVSSTTLQLATMVLVTVPILIVYPFVQKHFVKGIRVGSVKG